MEGKLVDRTIDLPFEDLSELLFGEGNCYSETEVRKRMYGMKRIFDVMDDEKEKSISDTSILDSLDLKKEELQKERYKLQATKIEYNRNIRHDSRFELFYDNIKDAITALPNPEYDFMESPQQHKTMEYLLAISDIHYGASFESLNNSYSRQICKERFELLFSNMVDKIKTQGISNLKVVNLGDTIQGLIHLSDLKINEIPVVDAVVEVSRLIANFLNELSAYVYIEYYHVPSSNHTQTRNLGSKANELATEDLEKIIINYIHDLLANNQRVRVYKDFKHDYIPFDILGYKCCALHGHQIRSLNTLLTDLSMLHKEWYSIVFMGHQHTAKELTVGEGIINNAEVLVSPSFIGSCPYSDRLMVGGKAMCKLYEFDEKHGHVGTQNIILN